MVATSTESVVRWKAASPSAGAGVAAGASPASDQSQGRGAAGARLKGAPKRKIKAHSDPPALVARKATGAFESCAPGDPLRGVSVHHLDLIFRREVEDAGLTQKHTIADVEDVVVRNSGLHGVCPRDGRLGSSYVDMLSDSDHVGQASYMLSYTWGYAVEDVVDSFVYYCEKNGLDPKRTYVWICAVCINQHRVQEAKLRGENVGFEVFAEAFGSRVRGIRHIIALMGPWQAPKYLERAWCIFELAMAIQIEGCRLDILMPSREACSFARAIVQGPEGLDKLWTTLHSVCLRRAEATVSSDKENILTFIERGLGLLAVNSQVRARLKTWFAGAAEEKARFMLQRHDCNGTKMVEGVVRVARMLAELGDMDRALALLDAARRKLPAARAANCCQDNCRDAVAEATVTLTTAVGLTRQKVGDLRGALAELEEAWRLRSARAAGAAPPGGRPEGPELAELLGGLGAVRCRLEGRAEEGLQDLLRVRAMRASEGSLDSALGAGLLLEIALAAASLGDAASAAASYAEAQPLFATHGGLTMPSNVHIVCPTDERLLYCGRYFFRELLTNVKQATSASRADRSSGSLRGTYLLTVQAWIHLMLRQFAEARDCCEQALKSHEQMGTSSTVFAADALAVNARSRAGLGDPAGAAACAEGARRCREGLGLARGFTLLPLPPGEDPEPEAPAPEPEPAPAAAPEAAPEAEEAVAALEAKFFGPRTQPRQGLAPPASSRMKAPKLAEGLPVRPQPLTGMASIVWARQTLWPCTSGVRLPSFRLCAPQPPLPPTHFVQHRLSGFFGYS